MKKFQIGVFATIFACISSAALAQTMYTIQHQAPPTINKNSPANLEFIVPGLNQGDVLTANVFYRFEGDFSYRQQELRLQNGSFIFIPPLQNTNSSRIEYYFQLSTISGDDYFFPDNLPSENPVSIEIISTGQPKEVRNSLSEIDYTLVSPDENAVLAPNEVYFAIALYYDEALLPEGEFKLFIDDIDVTEFANVSPYFISYTPRNLRLGRHTARLDYLTSSEDYLVVDWEFTVVDPSQSRTFDDFGPQTRPVGNVEFTARNQVISGDINNALTGRTSITGANGKFRYSLNGFFTSQESNRLQPQNRFGADLEYGKWWNLQAGHVFPMMGDFTIAGRRVFGIHSALNLANNNIKAQFITGEINRKVTNLYTSIEANEQSFNGQVVDTTYTLGFESQGRGTFKRKIIGGRLAFGNERKFQFGLQAIKVQDDTTSIFNAQNFTDILSGNPNLAQNLSPDNFQRLNENPDLLQIESGFVQPRGNFVLATDAITSFSENKIRFRTEAAVSALNNNIYDGPLTIERASDLGFDITEKSENLLSNLSRFIIVNENMNVLPIRVKNFNTDSSDAEVYFPSNLLASNSELAFVYPQNNLTVQYRWIGSEFNSLANSTIRKDIAGFTLSDRFRMLENRMYVTLGLESLRDNVNNQRDATTRTNTYRTNVSWYPISNDLPRVSVGLRYRTRNNGLDRFNPDVPSQFLNSAVQNLTISGTDTLTTTTPRQSSTIDLNTSLTQQFEWLNIIHDASLNVSNLNTKDEAFTYGDVQSKAFSLNLSSRFQDYDLRTQLGLTFNNTKTGNGQLDIKIFGLYTGATYFIIDNKLNLNGRLALTTNRVKSRNLIVEPNSSSDNNPFNDYFILDDFVNESKFATFVFQLGAQYDIDRNQALIFDSNLTNVTGAGNANDRVIQLRYILRF